jgi:hypothetical protein
VCRVVHYSVSMPGLCLHHYIAFLFPLFPVVGFVFMSIPCVLSWALSLVDKLSSFPLCQLLNRLSHGCGLFRVQCFFFLMMQLWRTICFVHRPRYLLYLIYACQLCNRLLFQQSHSSHSSILAAFCCSGPSAFVLFVLVLFQ